MLLTQDAACRDADPGLFDAVEGPYVQYALAFCARWPLVEECDTFVKPRKSFYDGVAAGKVWRNGRIVDPEQDVLFDAVN